MDFDNCRSCLKAIVCYLFCENGANVVNILENQEMAKSMKKKKKAKQFDDGEN